MKELVINHNGQPCTTSRLVAEKFGKRHSDVLRSIENLECSEGFTQRNFALSEYEDPTGRKLPRYIITRDGFSFLVMGFTGKEAARFKEEFIKAFTAMEEFLKGLTNNEDAVLLQAFDILQKKAALQSKELKKQVPKVEYHDKVLRSQSTYTANQIAKEMGTSAVTLNKLLHERKVQYKQGEVWLLYHPYQDKGYTKTKTYTYIDEEGKIKSRMMTVWTEAGRKFIHEKLENKYVEA